MEFKRYPSIERVDNQKNLEYWLSHYPELREQKYVVTEKLDGTNIVIGIDENGKLHIGRRNDWLKDDEDHYGVREFLKEHPYMDRFKKFRNTYFYLELVGPKINNRIKYNKDIYLLDFYNNEFATFGKMFDIEVDIHTETLLCNYPISFEEAINFDVTNLESDIAIKVDGKKQIAEGVVIKPSRKDYIAPNGSRFILKKHSPQFSEIKGKPQKLPTSENVREKQMIFSNYITQNRLINIFSKHGKIKDKTEVGKYIKLLMDDAKEDFHKEYPYDDEREIYYLGNKIAAQLVLNSEY